MTVLSYPTPATDQDIEQLPKHPGIQGQAAELITVNVLLGRYRYVAGLGWLEWRDGYWQDMPANKHTLRDSVRLYIVQHVDDLQRDGRADQATLWKALLTAANVNGVISFCRDMHGVLTSHTELDTNPDVLNVRNGTLNLETGMLNPHNPGLLLTKMAGAAYDPNARSTVWAKALSAIPPDVVDWFQLRVGQALTGHSEDSLVLTVGGGENGKSAVMHAIMRALGTYAGALSHRVLLQTMPGQHPTELMDLRGLRLALMEETPEEGNLDTHALKTVIGTPFITARRMRQDSVTFPTTHSLFINTNHYPLVSTTDHGTWRRLRAVRFPYRFLPPGRTPNPERPMERAGDPDLKRQIGQDPTLPAAVLAWAVAGARRWYADPGALHILPPGVAQASEAWRADSDVGYQFAADHLERSPGRYIAASTLAGEFNAFLEHQGKRAWSNRVIAGRLPASIKAALGVETGVQVIKTDKGEASNPPTDQWDKGANLFTPVAGKTVRAWTGIAFRQDRS